MRKDGEVRLYNIFLPIWLLLFWPSPLWLAVIPVNYLIDRVVLRWSLGDMPDKGLFCRKHTWKICLAGFAGDFAGAALLFAVYMAGADNSGPELFEDLAYGVGFNPFSHPLAFLCVAAAVAAAGVLIYFIDRAILKGAGLTPVQAKRSALRLALITAPYLYFFPSTVLYGGSLSVV